MTEAKGSDVRAACGRRAGGVQAARDSSNEPLEVKIIEAASDGYVNVTPEKCECIRQLIEARVQAAAVEMRSECAKATLEGDFGIYNTILALPTPTDALDAMLKAAQDDIFVALAGAMEDLEVPFSWDCSDHEKSAEKLIGCFKTMLLRARIEEHIELHAKGACGTGECLRLKNQRAELAALTQPAPERKEK